MTGLRFPKPRHPLLVREERRKKQEHLAAMLRAQIRARDGHHCRYCGNFVRPNRVLPSQRAEIAHIVPRSLAPARKFDLSNLLLLCAICHARIHAHELEFVGTDQATIIIQVADKTVREVTE